MQRIGLNALIALAVLLVGTVGYVVFTGRERAWAEPDDFSRSDDPVVPLDKAPVIEFPESQRTYDVTLNRFLDRFIRTTREGRYGEFRTMWTRDLDPVSAESYQKIWSNVRAVRIKQVVRAPKREGITIDAYVIEAEVEIAPESGHAPSELNRTIRMLAIREGDDWVFAPPSVLRKQRS